MLTNTNWTTITWSWRSLTLCLVAGLLSGCGDSGSQSTTADSQDPANSVSAGSGETRPLPTASIQSPATQTAALPSQEVSETGEKEKAAATEAQSDKTAPELLKEIEYLQSLPLASQPAAGEKLDPKKVGLALSQRNREVVERAQAAIFKAVKNKDAEEVLLKAVTALSEARLQLALQGDEENADLLFGDAAFLQDKFPGSEAAMQAAYASVRFAHHSAKLMAAQDSKWLVAFARNAQLFSQNFPDFEQKTLPLLLAAGNSCDSYGLSDEAKICFSQIRQQYPESEVAKNSQGILRRLSLPGKPLKFGGSTYGGDFLKIDKYIGKTTVIVYWSSNSADVQQYLTRVDQICKKVGASTIGVALDEDELALEQTVGETGIKWQQVFSGNPEQRRWETPVVKYYGVNKVPSLWIMKADGTVLTCSAQLDTLEETLQAEIKR